MHFVMSVKFFITDRLILRPWEESDAEDCFKYACDPRVGPDAGWAPHTSVEYSREIIKKNLSGPEDCAIVLKETRSAIGSISLHLSTRLARKGNEAELGFWLGVPYWGQGVAAEASRRLMEHGFEDMHLERIWCGYYDGNDKSRRVQEKLGFKYVKTVDDAPGVIVGDRKIEHVNVLEREDWEKICH